MGLLDRVSTLIRANLNDLVDRAEDPSKMIKQVILDMENQLLQVKTQVAISIADQHMLEKKEQESREKIAHDFLEAFFVMGGSGAFRIEGRPCRCQTGDVIVIPVGLWKSGIRPARRFPEPR